METSSANIFRSLHESFAQRFMHEQDIPVRDERMSSTVKTLIPPFVLYPLTRLVLHAYDSEHYLVSACLVVANGRYCFPHKNTCDNPSSLNEPNTFMLRGNVSTWYTYVNELHTRDT